MSDLVVPVRGDPILLVGDDAHYGRARVIIGTGL